MRASNDRRAVLTHDFIEGHEYEVVVRAVGVDGVQEPMESAARAVIRIESKQDSPSAPTDLATDGYLNAITLTWVNPEEYDAEFVEVWRASTDDIDAATLIAQVKGITYIDVVGMGDVTRYYWLRARNTSGVYSAYTDSVSGTTDGVIATDIDDFAVTATKLFTNTIILAGDSWTNNSPGAGSVAWNAHTIVYNGASYPISAGNTALAYIYWIIGNTTYTGSAAHPALGTTAFMIAINTSGTHTMVWNSSANMVIGTAFIANLAVTEGKIANLAVAEAKIANLAVTNAKIADLAVSKLTAGTITSKTIELAVADGDGDAYIAAGKTDFTNTDAGFILGVDDSDANKAKLYIGDANKYLNWDGAALTVQGTVQTAASGKRAVISSADGLYYVYNTAGEEIARLGYALEEGYMRLRNGAGEEITTLNSGAIIIRAHVAAPRFTMQLNTVTKMTIGSDGIIDSASYIDAAGGFKVDGTAIINSSKAIVGVTGITVASGNITLTAAGATVDGVDVSTHIHNAAAGQGAKITHSNLLSIGVNDHHAQSHSHTSHTGRLEADDLAVGYGDGYYLRYDAAEGGLFWSAT